MVVLGQEAHLCLGSGLGPDEGLGRIVEQECRFPLFRLEVPIQIVDVLEPGDECRRGRAHVVLRTGY